MMLVCWRRRQLGLTKNGSEDDWYNMVVYGSPKDHRGVNGSPQHITCGKERPHVLYFSLILSAICCTKTIKHSHPKAFVLFSLNLCSPYNFIQCELIQQYIVLALW
ncbi:hypothetical protein PAHAL_4G285700 [Panicum hallii]|uniref:Uncharacterized protein n=2 Tax=Panicum hallii TaxID=206008 RepID=A0A2S3HKV6_9POAL|nr:hypothetical protein PAHAL_4G285700 [Panicum hallii]PAN25230.1 hypothetical protein PAHAL_4G285700 [Panicum hallii]PAN25231.1 hypothetical protein PAHAL_4G285700 [Panicum hallii]